MVCWVGVPRGFCAGTEPETWIPRVSTLGYTKMRHSLHISDE